MENKIQEALAMKVIATLDAILNKMADVLNERYEPGEPESMKLLREFRSTMNSRRIWAKSCGLNVGNEETGNNLPKKVETSASKQPAPTAKKPVIMNKPEGTMVNGIFFEGIKCKNNNPTSQVDLNSGLVYRR